MRNHRLQFAEYGGPKESAQRAVEASETLRRDKLARSVETGDLARRPPTVQVCPNASGLTMHSLRRNHNVVDDAKRAAREFMALYQRVYLLLHRRVERGERPLTMQSQAVLEHLAYAGPLTIGEMAQHLDRAQSVVSEIVDQLEGNGLIARVKDPSDRRRTLVWLTDEAIAFLERSHDVLDCERLATCLQALAPSDREVLLRSFGVLVDLADSLRTPKETDHGPLRKLRNGN